MTTNVGRLQSRQLLLAVATATLLSIVCNATATPTASKATGHGRTPEMHTGHAHKNMAHVYANHVGHQQQQQQHQQQQQAAQQPYYDIHYERNSSSDSNHNGIAAHTGAETAALDGDRKTQRRSYNGFSVSGGGSGAGGAGAHNVGGSSSYNFGAAKLNGLTNLSGLRHISSGFGGAWSTSGHGGAGATGGATTITIAAKQHIPIYEEQQENDYGAATLGASGAAGHAAQENNQHGGSNGWSSSAGSSSSSSSYNSGRSSGKDALSTALYNLHSAGTHNGFLPSAFAGKYSSSAAGTTAYAGTPTYQQSQQLQQPNDKISDGNFLHRYGHNSGGYDELTTSATYAHEQQQAPMPSAMQYFMPHDSYASMHTGGADAATSSASADADISFGHHHSGGSGSGGDAEVEEDESGGKGSSYDDSTNYLSEQHDDAGSHVINYIPYKVVKKVHVPVREPVQIPISHAIVVPVNKPVPIHIPVTKHVPVPVEKELRVPVERVVPYPVEKPVPVPVEKRVPFKVVKYVPVHVPHPFPVKVPVFKTILHKVKGGMW
ncbi:PE-PGRS family protein PE_PGRS30 isoform X1 [Bactrocera dorsalis]|uniref:PE-PGRS family protein PE_PGRS30 isoform X1 n=1 Tax=Bactrocera dorsalis TaxID=27457 RepID=A0A6I9W410_BACDO|nr:PE-PGRS family protein PE_PGRS30 isoform X1 [Bactrocera dorsalis]